MVDTQKKSDTWEMFTWINIQKMLLLIVAIAVFFPVVYFLYYPNIGAFGSIIIYFAFLILVALLIRKWGKEKFKEKS